MSGALPDGEAEIELRGVTKRFSIGDDEIEALAKKIVAEVSKRTGGVLRT